MTTSFGSEIRNAWTPRDHLNEHQYDNLKEFWYAISELSHIAQAPESGGRLITLKILCSSVAETFWQLDRQRENLLKGGGS
jgi:hypothetical protein